MTCHMSFVKALTLGNCVIGEDTEDHNLMSLVRALAMRNVLKI